MKALFFNFLFLINFLAAESPSIVYLTLEGDASNTMTVHVILDKDQENLEIYLDQKTLYKTKQATLPQTGKKHYQATIHNLTPNTLYFFTLNKEEKKYYFKTLPDHFEKPIKFVVGGDMYHDSLAFLKKSLRSAASLNPDFALLGGDLAYAGTKFFYLKQDEKRWITFMKALSETMITEDNRLIPFIATLGNHDISGRYDQTLRQAPYYTLFFLPQNSPSNFAVHIADLITILVLDSGHAQPVKNQVPFIEQTLKTAEEHHIPHKFALYHVPAYPSYRDFHKGEVKAVRTFFVPSFEKYGLAAAFEHHDHTYKRTFPIKDNKVDCEKGVLYIGDGAWGVENPRIPKKPEETWYLNTSQSIANFVLVEVEQDKRTYKAFNADGELIDYFR
jgi:acid phosphatase type 7